MKMINDSTFEELRKSFDLCMELLGDLYAHGYEYEHDYLDILRSARKILQESSFIESRNKQRVRKIGGSFQHTGTVVAEFVTTSGQPRIVLEFDAPVAGMLHVYLPDQVEIITADDSDDDWIDKR